MQKNKKRRGVNYSRMRCPYCGSPVIFRSADGIYRSNEKRTMLYVCSRYPLCNSYIRVHKGTKIPVGELANPELRSLRRQAHASFDRLYLSGFMSKQDAYLWLSDITCTPLSRAHIGYMGEYNCRLVMEESKKLLEKKKVARISAAEKEAKPHEID